MEKFLLAPDTPIVATLPLPDHFALILQEDIQEQTKIGWHAAIKGLLSQKWLALVSLDASNQHCKSDSQAGSHRHRELYAYLHDYTRAIWIGRNDALHHDKETAATPVYSAESAELRHLHGKPQLLPSSDSLYCTIMTLDRMIRSRPSV